MPPGLTAIAVGFLIDDRIELPLAAHAGQHQAATTNSEGRGDVGALLGCGSKEQCLQVVDEYFVHAARQTYAAPIGLVQTYGPGSIGGGPCGDDLCKLVEPCPNYALMPHCRFDVYDNALAAIYLTKRGHLHEARAILDAFVALLYPTGNVTPGLDYGAGALLPSQLHVVRLYNAIYCVHVEPERRQLLLYQLFKDYVVRKYALAVYSRQAVISVTDNLLVVHVTTQRLKARSSNPSPRLLTLRSSPSTLRGTTR